MVAQLAARLALRLPHGRGRDVGTPSPSWCTPSALTACTAARQQGAVARSRCRCSRCRARSTLTLSATLGPSPPATDSAWLRRCGLRCELRRRRGRTEALRPAGLAGTRRAPVPCRALSAGFTPPHPLRTTLPVSCSVRDASSRPSK